MIILDPIKYERTNVGNVVYPDCLEVSLLRIIHILFMDAETLNDDETELEMDMEIPKKDRLIDSDYFSTTPSSDILKYFQQYHTIRVDSWSYSNNASPDYGSLKERSEWCQLLHDNETFCGIGEGFCYVHNQDVSHLYELSAVWENAVNFFFLFFPKLMNEICLKSDDVDFDDEEAIATLFETIYNTLYGGSERFEVEFSADLTPGESSSFIDAIQTIMLISDTGYYHSKCYKWNMYHALHKGNVNTIEQSFGTGQGGGTGHSDLSVAFTLSDL